jgi:hypothetical protein
MGFSLFSIILLALLPGSARAGSCNVIALLKSLQNSLHGPQFLHQRNPNLHRVPEVARGEDLARKLWVNKPHLPRNRIAAWLATLETTHRPERGAATLQRLKDHYYRRYVIRPDAIPKSFFETQTRIARDLGHGENTLNAETRARLIENIIAEQKASLDKWFDYFLSPDTSQYPMWAKVWVFEEMTKLKALESGQLQFLRRSISTTGRFPELNKEALGKLIDGLERLVIKNWLDGLDPESAKLMRERLGNKSSLNGLNPEFANLLKEGSFPNIYAWTLKAVSAEKGDLTVTAGRWVPFPKGSSEDELVKSLDCKGTGWCTVGPSTARSQLDAGDFHVYYSNDVHNEPTQPRIAIRMDGDSIAEVRGIAKEQNLDPWIAETDVLDLKLAEFGEEGVRYRKRSRDMRRLTAIEHRAKAKAPLSKEDLRFLYEIDERVEGFGYEKDPRILGILSKRDPRADLSVAVGVDRNKISLTQEEALSGDIELHYRDLDLADRTSTQGLVLPRAMVGDLNLQSIESPLGLTLPKQVTGSLTLTRLKSAEGLVLPERISGGLGFMSLKSAKGLKLPESIGGDLILGFTSAEGLVLPKSLGGSLHLRRLKSAKGLILPERVGGLVHFDGLSAGERDGLRLKYPKLKIEP